MERPSLVPRVVLAIGASASALVLGEVAVRTFDVGPTFQVVLSDSYQLAANAELGHELRPGAPDGEHRISEQGLRDQLYSRERPPGVFRIAAIGDSVTFGLGCAREDSYPEQLERLLDEASGTGGRHFEVLNFGVTGYNVEQAAEQMGSTVLGYEPDLVIYGYVLNDPQASSFEGDTLNKLRAEVADSVQPPLGSAIGRLAARSRLYLLARHVLFHRQGESLPLELASLPEDPGFVAARSDATGQYFRTLHAEGQGGERVRSAFADLGRLSKEARVPVVVAVFPLFTAPGRDYPLRDVHAQVLAWAREAGLDAVDLAPVFAGGPPAEDWAIDFIHPTATGYRRAAEALLAHLTGTGTGTGTVPVPVPVTVPRGAGAGG